MFWVWMSSYFGFCAIFMLWIALRVRTQIAPQMPSPRNMSLRGRITPLDSST